MTSGSALVAFLVDGRGCARALALRQSVLLCISAQGSLEASLVRMWTRFAFQDVLRRFLRDLPSALSPPPAPANWYSNGTAAASREDAPDRRRIFLSVGQLGAFPISRRRYWRRRTAFAKTRFADPRPNSSSRRRSRGAKGRFGPLLDGSWPLQRAAYAGSDPEAAWSYSGPRSSGGARRCGI